MVWCVGKVCEAALVVQQHQLAQWAGFGPTGTAEWPHWHWDAESSKAGQQPTAQDIAQTNFVAANLPPLHHDSWRCG